MDNSTLNDTINNTITNSTIVNQTINNSYYSPTPVIQSHQILSFMPDWLLFSMAFFLILIIYYIFTKNNPTLKSSVGKFFKNWGIYVALFVFWLYFRNKWGLVGDDPNRWPATMGYATFIVLLIFILYFAFSTWLYEQRYYTHQFTCDNISGSCKRYQEIGVGDNTWVVFFLGTSGSSDEKFVVPWPWTKKLVVVPKRTCQFLGNHIISIAQVHKIDLYELDPAIKNFIEKDTFGKWSVDEIYKGFADAAFIAKNPQLRDLEDKNEKLNARINELDDMLKGQLGRYKLTLSEMMAMKDRASGVSILRRRDPQQSSGGNE